MEKRLTVDLSEEDYKKLLKIQFEQVLSTSKKPALGDLIREAIKQWLDTKEKAAQS